MGPIPINDLQIPRSPPPVPLKSGQIGSLVQKDLQCYETCDKTIFPKIRTGFCELDSETVTNVSW